MADISNASEQEESIASDHASATNENGPSTSTSSAAPISSSGGGDCNAVISSNISLFECPVCFEHILPPVMQCLHGHLICKNCRKKLTSCPMCRGPLPNIRNLAMDKLAATMKFPCKHANHGCTASLAHTEKLAHEEICEHRHYLCPCPGDMCEWQGQLDALTEHIQTAHRDITIVENEKARFEVFGVNIAAGVAWVMRQKCFGQQFLVFMEKKRQHDEYFQYRAMVQLVGAKTEAIKYDYILQLGNGQQRFTWRSKPVSMQEETGECLLFDTPLAERFKEDGKIQLIVTIAETSDGSETDTFSNDD